MGGFTDKEMQAKATDADQWLTGEGPRGVGKLVGRITRRGERLFYFRYTPPGGARDMYPLGNYHPKGTGGLTLARARTRVNELRALCSSGVGDLRAHFAQLEQTENAERLAADDREQAATLERERRISVRVLFDRWAKTDLTPRTGTDGKRTGRKDGGQYSRQQFERRIFPALGDMAAADVRKSDVQAILDAVKAEGKLRTCNVLLSDMKQMMRFAVERDIIPHSPLESVTKKQAGGAATTRERVLSVDEIAELSRKMPAARLNPRTAAAVWLLLSTGARIGELMGAAWADPGVDLRALAAVPEAAAVKVGLVDTTAGTWHLPTTKNERAHMIHLSDFALAQFGKLAALREVGADGALLPWIFPNTAANGPVCVKSFGKQLADRQRTPDRRLKGRSKKTDSLTLPGGKWTAHDCRRTAGTVLASMGVSGDVIDECLNHVIESTVRRTYIRDRRPVEQARAFDALGEKLEEIVKGTKDAPNVVPLRTAGVASGGRPRRPTI